MDSWVALNIITLYYALGREFKPQWQQTLFQTQAQHLRFLHDSIWFILFDTIICLSNLSFELWNRKLKIKEIHFLKKSEYCLATYFSFYSYSNGMCCIDYPVFVNPCLLASSHVDSISCPRVCSSLKSAMTTCSIGLNVTLCRSWLFIMQHTSIYYLSSRFFWNNHELIRVLVTANVTIHKTVGLVSVWLVLFRLMTQHLLYDRLCFSFSFRPLKPANRKINSKFSRTKIYMGRVPMQRLFICSVNRFSQILLLWRNFKSLAILSGFIFIWQILNLLCQIFIIILANFS